MSSLTHDGQWLRTAPDVYFVSVGQGAWLRNARGSMTILGQHAYPLVEWLLPRLDGQTDLDRLLGDLDPGRQRAIRGVLETLVTRGFVQAVGPRPVPPPQWEELYGEELAFLDYYAPDPLERFAAFRACRIAVVGRGRLLRAVVTALCEAGAASLSVVLARALPDETLAALLRAASRRDRELDARTSPPASSLAAAVRQAADGGADVIVAASDELSLDQLPALLPDRGRFATLLVRGGLVLSTVFTLGDASAWVPCPTCLERAVAGEAPVVLGPGAPPPAAALAAHDVATSLFLHVTGLTGLQPPTLPVATVDTADLSLRRHVVPRHPDCADCARPVVQERGAEASAPGVADDGLVRPAVPAPLAPAEESAAQDQIVAHIASLTDPVVGPLLESGEDDIAQLPDAASYVLSRARSSTAAAPRTVRLLVTAASAREARNQAALFAAERWLASPSPGAAGPAADPSAPQGAGAGWSQAEAEYRALLGASLSWALASGQQPGTAAVDIDGVADPLVRQLRALLADSDVSVGRATCQPAPTGMVIARLAGPAGGEATLAAGLTESDALATALAIRLCSLHGQQHGAAERLTAVAPPPCETWRAAVGRALAGATARAVTVSRIPAPFPGGIAAAQAVIRC